MRRLSEFRGVDAVDVLAELMVPAVNIMQDERIQNMLKKQVTVAELASFAVKNYRDDIFSVLTIMSGEDEYNPNVFELLNDVIEIFSDTELLDFFGSQAQLNTSDAFGLAMEATTETEVG